MALITLFNQGAKSSVTSGGIQNTVGTIHLNDAIPAVTSYGAFIYNFTDETLTVTPQISAVNVDINNGKSSPFISLTPITIDANSGGALQYNFNDNPAPYFQVSLTTTATSGTIEGFYFVNYLYTR